MLDLLRKSLEMLDNDQRVTPRSRSCLAEKDSPSIDSYHCIDFTCTRIDPDKAIDSILLFCGRRTGGVRCPLYLAVVIFTAFDLLSFSDRMSWLRFSSSLFRTESLAENQGRTFGQVVENAVQVVRSTRKVPGEFSDLSADSLMCTVVVSVFHFRAISSWICRNFQRNPQPRSSLDTIRRREWLQLWPMGTGIHVSSCDPFVRQFICSNYNFSASPVS